MKAWADRKRCACGADLNLCICHFRQRVGRCEFSARLLPGMIYDDATGVLGETARRLYPGLTRTGASEARGRLAELSHELGARIVIWAPLRLAWMRCERGSVSVVLPIGSRDVRQEDGGPT
jgi:hypothetical protein